MERERELATTVRPRLTKMKLILWSFRMVKDVVAFGIVNGSYGMSFGLLTFLVVGVTIFAAQVSAPFIYTLF